MSFTLSILVSENLDEILALRNTSYLFTRIKEFRDYESEHKRDLFLTLHNVCLMFYSVVLERHKSTKTRGNLEIVSTVT